MVVVKVKRYTSMASVT